MVSSGLSIEALAKLEALAKEDFLAPVPSYGWQTGYLLLAAADEQCGGGHGQQPQNRRLRYGQVYALKGQSSRSG